MRRYPIRGTEGPTGVDLRFWLLQTFNGISYHLSESSFNAHLKLAPESDKSLVLAEWKDKNVLFTSACARLA